MKRMLALAAAAITALSIAGCTSPQPPASPSVTRFDSTFHFYAVANIKATHKLQSHGRIDGCVAKDADMTARTLLVVRDESGNILASRKFGNSVIEIQPNLTTCHFNVTVSLPLDEDDFEVHYGAVFRSTRNYSQAQLQKGVLLYVG